MTQKPSRVAILGAGVAGLTVAHELIERGFDVTIYERRRAPGGKARSIPAKGTGIQERRDLPGEHGFRFFPGFYRHVIDTMSRIPYEGKHVVERNLRQAPRCMMAQFNTANRVVPFGFPRSLADVWLLIKAIVQGNGVPFRDNLHFLRCLWVMMTSCEQRYIEEYEWIDYWDFIGADSRSEAYQRIVGQGFTRSLVAMKAEMSSTRTVGTVFTQMIYPMFNPFSKEDRLLNGPTSDVWIYPWVSYLERLGVKVVYGTEVNRLVADSQNGVIEELILAQVAPGESVSPVGPQAGLQPIQPVLRKKRGTDFDFVVSALPVDTMNRLLQTSAGEEFVKAVPSLRFIKDLQTRWMNGIQIYLKKDVPIVEGHVLYVDSPWALTSISQKQFWRQCEIASCGDGTVGGVLSVDISDYETPSLLKFDTPAGPLSKKGFECSHEEIFQEVWHELKQSLNHGDAPLLEDDNVVTYFIDDDIRPDIKDRLAKGGPYGSVLNTEPLFINCVGSLHCRPDTQTELSNFFLASDYVRTYTDLATMEAASESGRRAANAVLDAVGSPAERAGVWPLHQPWYVRPWQWLDRWLFGLGKPNLFSAPEMRAPQRVPDTKPAQTPPMLTVRPAKAGAKSAGTS